MKRRPGIELWLLALVCFGPMIAAYWLYFYGDTSALPLVPNEERVLVRPAVPLADAGDLGLSDRQAQTAAQRGWGPRWTLLYLRTSACDETCRADLVRLAQVHAALGRDQSRVRRAYVGPDAAERASADPSLAAAPSTISAADALLDVLESAGVAAHPAGRVYVVDPHGNLVLGYPPDPDQEGLLDDLERLLDVSQIG